jgi:ferritin-like protein
VEQNLVAAEQNLVAAERCRVEAYTHLCEGIRD